MVTFNTFLVYAFCKRQFYQRHVMRTNRNYLIQTHLSDKNINFLRVLLKNFISIFFRFQYYCFEKFWSKYPHWEHVNSAFDYNVKIDYYGPYNRTCCLDAFNIKNVFKNESKSKHFWLEYTFNTIFLLPQRLFLLACFCHKR